MDATYKDIRENGWSPLAPASLVAFSVMIATFMEVLDSTIVNVSLPHIAGSLSAGVDESTWVLTSYLVSNAIVLPTTGWFSMVFGRKRFYMVCVLAFTIASFLCGLAPSLPWLVFFRVLQGLGGGAMQPISQAILLDSYPMRRRGFGMALFGIGVVFAPIIGPTLGGWITDTFSWRWVFFINIPIGMLSLIMTKMNVKDPPYIRRGTKMGVDYFGLGLLAVGIGAVQIVLDKGQREDWFQTSWILQLALVAVVCIVVLIIWERRAKNPILDLAVFRVHNFVAGNLLIFALGIVLYGSMMLTPLFLQSLLGYSAMLSGMAMSPGGVGTLICMPIVGFLVGKKDARYLVAAGLVTLSASMFLMSRFSLQIGFWDVVWPRVVTGVGLAFLFVPITTLTVAFMPPERIGAATGIFNLLRNIGGSAGIALMTTMLARRAQFHQATLVEHVSPYNPAYQHIYSTATSKLIAAGQPALLAQKQAMGIFYKTTLKQASTMAFVDCFWLLGVLIAVMLPIVFIIKRPPKHAKPVGGAH